MYTSRILLAGVIKIQCDAGSHYAFSVIRPPLHDLKALIGLSLHQHVNVSLPK